MCWVSRKGRGKARRAAPPSQGTMRPMRMRMRDAGDLVHVPAVLTAGAGPGRGRSGLRPLPRPETAPRAAPGCNRRARDKGDEKGGVGEPVAPRQRPSFLPGVRVAKVWALASPPGTSLGEDPSEPLPRPLPRLPSFLFPPPVPPTIEQGTEDTGTLVRRSGELVTMACPVRGSPPIRVSWLKDGLPLPLSQRTHLLGSGRILR